MYVFLFLGFFFLDLAFMEEIGKRNKMRSNLGPPLQKNFFKKKTPQRKMMFRKLGKEKTTPEEEKLGNKIKHKSSSFFMN